MPIDSPSRLPEILRRYQSDILADWVRQQMAGLGKIRENEARESGESADISGPAWAQARDFLVDLSRNRALHAGLQLHDPALIAGVIYRDHQCGRDDATVVVVRKGPAAE